MATWQCVIWISVQTSRADNWKNGNRQATFGIFYSACFDQKSLSSVQHFILTADPWQVVAGNVLQEEDEALATSIFKKKHHLVTAGDGAVAVQAQYLGWTIADSTVMEAHETKIICLLKSPPTPQRAHHHASGQTSAYAVRMCTRKAHEVTILASLITPRLTTEDTIYERREWSETQ